MPVIAGIPAAVAAIFALLIAFAVGMLVRAVAQMFPSRLPVSPGIGIPIRGIIESAANALLSGAEIIFGVFVRPVIGVIARPVISLLAFASSFGNFVQNVAVMMQWVVQVAIPEALWAAKLYAARAVLNVWHDAQIITAAARAFAATLAARAQYYALALYHDALRYAHDGIAAARVYAYDITRAEASARAAADAAVKGYAVSLVKGVESDLGRAVRALQDEISGVTGVTSTAIASAVSAGVSAAEQYAQGAATAAAGALTTDVTAAVAAVFPGLIDDVDKLAGVLATDLPDIGAALSAIPRAVPTDIAGALTLDLALAVPMLRYLRECGIPNCRNLGGLGRALQDLFGAIEGAGFLGLIAYMVSDPQAAAQAAQNELGPVADGLVHAARDLIGV